MSELKTLNIKLVPIDQITPYALNSKKHDNAQVERIMSSIRQFGWDQPIVVDANYEIIKGHGRRLAAIQLGLKQVPVLVRDDLSPDEVRAARLADNRVAISDIDSDLLREELSTLNFDLAGIFDEKELEFTAADLGTMEEDAFIDDIDAAVNEQDLATKQRIEELSARRIPIIKALGFKDIKGSDEIVVSRFVAHAEHKTGKQGEEAFVEFLRKLLAGVSHE